jgi:hypothetical protein
MQEVLAITEIMGIGTIEQVAVVAQAESVVLESQVDKAEETKVHHILMI